MKTFLTLLTLFFSISFSSISQILIDTNKIWTESDNFSGPRIYFFEGDKAINSLNYKKLYVTYDSTLVIRNYNCALREDTNSHIYVNENSVERLLYDFSLNLGDTFYQGWMNIPMIVDSVDTVTLLNGESRRRMFFSYYHEYWIDGIGSTFGLLNVDFYDLHFDIDVALNCFIENDTIKYHGLSNISCYQTTTNIKNIATDNSFNLLPNPFENCSFLEIKRSLTKGHLQIYNCNGTLVRSDGNLYGNKIKIERGKLNEGLYFFSLTDKNNIIHGKFIVQ